MKRVQLDPIASRLRLMRQQLQQTCPEPESASKWPENAVLSRSSQMVRNMAQCCVSAPGSRVSIVKRFIGSGPEDGGQQYQHPGHQATAHRCVCTRVLMGSCPLSSGHREWRSEWFSQATGNLRCRISSSATRANWTRWVGQLFVGC